MNELRSIVEKHYSNMFTGGLEPERELFSPDVVTTIPGQTFDSFEGFGEFGVAFARACPDARMQIRSTVESGDTIAVQSVMSGTHTGPLPGPNGEIPATNKHFEFTFADFFQVQDGKVVRHDVYYDQLGLLGQLGLLPG
jgi:ketosteroid isomerase-like protein